MLKTLELKLIVSVRLLLLRFKKRKIHSKPSKQHDLLLYGEDLLQIAGGYNKLSIICLAYDDNDQAIKFALEAREYIDQARMAADLTKTLMHL